MLPRGKIDIGWSDLSFAVRRCLLPWDREATQRRVESLWPAASGVLACLSVRSAFDLLLRTLAYPRGSEILVSAITIRDITRIIEAHGLVPVPVDLDMEALAISREALERCVTEKSRAILIAHLFGSRMPLDDVIQFARKRELLDIEDCAQAYVGDSYPGHPGSDVCLFSFGPIKTNTALGGGVAIVRDERIAQRMRAAQLSDPVQSRWEFLRRVGKYILLKFLTYRVVFSAFSIACRITGRVHDDVASAVVRGFPGPDLLRQIRRQPSSPLLALIERRIRRFDSDLVERRAAIAETMAEFSPTLRRPGARANHHTHWVYPVQSPSPDRLMRHLWRHGFDATRGASSLCVVDPPAHRPDVTPLAARETMRQVLYLPVYPGVSDGDLKRLARAAAGFEENEDLSRLERREPAV
jgi:perosamine synthetase